MDENAVVQATITEGWSTGILFSCTTYTDEHMQHSFRISVLLKCLPFQFP